MTYILAVLVGYLIGFLNGKTYARKQFHYVGKKRPTTQDIILGGRK